jgi:hypothetical protein
MSCIMNIIGSYDLNTTQVIIKNSFQLSLSKKFKNHKFLDKASHLCPPLCSPPSHRPRRKQILYSNCIRTHPLPRGPSGHQGHTALTESLCSYCRGDSSDPGTQLDRRQPLPPSEQQQREHDLSATTVDFRCSPHARCWTSQFFKFKLN